MKLRVLALLAVLVLPAAARDPIKIYLVGDSTMAPKQANRRPETGWGEALQQYFDSSLVIVDNRARNGRSTRTFIEEGLWRALIDSLKPGNYVFIQFGHNDQSQDRPDRYTPPADYRRNLTTFITEVRRKRATPVLLTPVRRRRFHQSGEL